jgi:hypothetical protein
LHPTVLSSPADRNSEGNPESPKTGDEGRDSPISCLAAVGNDRKTPSIRNPYRAGLLPPTATLAAGRLAPAENRKFKNVIPSLARSDGPEDLIMA